MLVNEALNKRGVLTAKCFMSTVIVTNWDDVKKIGPSLSTLCSGLRPGTSRAQFFEHQWGVFEEIVLDIFEHSPHFSSSGSLVPGVFGSRNVRCKSVLSYTFLPTVCLCLCVCLLVLLWCGVV